MGGKQFARPDFFLFEFCAKLGAVVIIGNDEWQHRRQACDFQRVWNIAQALEQTEEFKGVPILYIRFNPHGYWRDGVYFSPKLKDCHQVLWNVLNTLTPNDIKNKTGVNLVFVHYDQTDGRVDVFSKAEEEQNDFALLYESCVVKVV